MPDSARSGKTRAKCPVEACQSTLRAPSRQNFGRNGHRNRPNGMCRGRRHRRSRARDGQNPMMPACDPDGTEADDVRKAVAPAWPLVEVRSRLTSVAAMRHAAKGGGPPGPGQAVSTRPAARNAGGGRARWIGRAGQGLGVSAQGGSLPDSPPSRKRIEPRGPDHLPVTAIRAPPCPAGRGLRRSSLHRSDELGTSCQAVHGTSAPSRCLPIFIILHDYRVT